ncbi:DUF3943 domain-containing protein [Shewanella abyssi]|uniref:DUF3943 domain-containing protein n=1 Tax=Shewanella abyssi TaxID=311789 RepID=UPI00200F1868|nr:DUF3943 domain-containing protein [Shewanella abyssi]MCL1048799.1 DUF3943 domain-containing protein [Shewanella abyssi]
MKIKKYAVFATVIFALKAPVWADEADPSAAIIRESQSDPAITLPQLIEKDWWGALAEISVVLVMGELLYKSGEESMKEDFDYEIEGNTGQYFVDRIVTTESWKLDDNEVGMNWGHAYAGALYHQAFRNYNFNYYESMLGNFLASGIWEVFAEYKEVVSINDQIVTTFGGSVLGESLFQLSEMLDTKDGWVPATFAAVFNPSRSIRGWFGYDSPNRFERRKAQDQFDIYTGVLYSTKAVADISTTTMLFGVEASIDSVQGQYDALSATPSLVELDMELGVSEEGVEDWQLSSSLFLGGYTDEVKPMTGSRDSWGHSWFVGPSMGIEYSSLGQEDEEDFYAAINVIGLSVGGEWQNADVNVSVRGDIFADFSMVKPFASKDYRASGGQFWGTKSVLWEGGYAYALGHTAKVKVEASYRDLLLGLKVTSQRWDSIDDKEFNRSSDWNPNKSDLDFKDSRDRYEVYLEVPISKTFGLSMHHERLDRSGTLAGIDNRNIFYRNDDSESRTSVRLAYRY